MATQRKKSGQTRTRTTRKSAKPPVTWEIPWTSQNLIGIGIGIGVIVLGYLLMGSAITDQPMTDKASWNNTTATVIAPILLTIAYCVIIPMAIFRRKKEGESVEVAVEAEG